MSAPEDRSLSETALTKARRGLKLVSASLPHLAGLAHSVRLRVDPRYPVAAIGATGLLLINPEVFATAPMPDLVFVLAHELLHLALDTFSRRGDAEPKMVNVAHDYIINDILTTELGRPVPLNGLVRPGARRESLEQLTAELARQGGKGTACWQGTVRRSGSSQGSSRRQVGKSKMQEELEKAGLLAAATPTEEPEPEPTTYPDHDLLSAEEEAALEPNTTPTQRRQLVDRMRQESRRAVNLHELRRAAQQAGKGQGQGAANDNVGEAFMDAILTAYTPPWQLALQHWLDSVAPGPRTYARPSRRGAGADVPLPGRTREGWTLHVVLDTSGSMVDTLPHILGLLASFCDAASVATLHVLQCDVGVTADAWLEPEQLAHYQVAGFGGSDMSPAMLHLAEDPDVAAVLVLTDGYIDFPAVEPPYAVLWGLVDGSTYFEPPYGAVVHVRL